MGDKTAARKAALDCDVDVVPGMMSPVENADEAMAFAQKAGFPVMLKAAMGGGGRGMRVVRRGENGAHSSDPSEIAVRGHAANCMPLFNLGDSANYVLAIQP